ncbi:hypothetical protein Tco_0360457 [Tanacetum coccineum]
MSARRSFSSLLLITMSSTYASRMSSPHLLAILNLMVTPVASRKHLYLKPMTASTLQTGLEIYVGYLTGRTIPAFTHSATSLVTALLFSGEKECFSCDLCNLEKSPPMVIILIGKWGLTIFASLKSASAISLTGSPDFAIPFGVGKPINAWKVMEIACIRPVPSGANISKQCSAPMTSTDEPSSQHTPYQVIGVVHPTSVASRSIVSSSLEERVLTMLSTFGGWGVGFRVAKISFGTLNQEIKRVYGTALLCWSLWG